MLQCMMVMDVGTGVKCWRSVIMRYIAIVIHHRSEMSDVILWHFDILYMIEFVWMNLPCSVSFVILTLATVP